mgnify:CR=1 FL=1
MSLRTLFSSYQNGDHYCTDRVQQDQQNKDSIPLVHLRPSQSVMNVRRIRVWRAKRRRGGRSSSRVRSLLSVVYDLTVTARTLAARLLSKHARIRRLTKADCLHWPRGANMRPKVPEETAENSGVCDFPCDFEDVV